MTTLNVVASNQAPIAVPAELKADVLWHGDDGAIHVLPPGRPLPPLPDGAWRSRIDLGSGWQAVVTNYAGR